MRFSSIVTAFAAYSGVATAALSAKQMVANIKTLTTKSQALQGPAQSVTLVNGPLIIIGQGPLPEVVLGFGDIIITTTTAIAQMRGSAAVTKKADADAIFEAFREFVRVHQALLNILIGKAGVFTIVPFIGYPVATTLRALEAVVDTIAFGIIDLVQSRAKDITDQAGSLHATVELSIGAYNGISFKNL